MLRKRMLGPALVLLPMASLAQGPTRPAEALASLERAAQALNTPAGRLKTLAAAGTFLDWRGAASPFRFFGDDRGRSRWERGDGKDADVTVVDGLAGFREVGGERRIVRPSETPGMRAEVFPALSLSTWIGSPRHRAWLDAEGRLEVGPAAPAGFERFGAQALERALRGHLEIDPGSGLPARLTVFRHPREQRVDSALEFRWSDYRELEGGSLQPFRVEALLADGRVVATWILEKVEVNVELDDALFR